MIGAQQLGSRMARRRRMRPHGQRVQEIRGAAGPWRIETVGEALKRETFSFKRNRYALKKT
jgi:hypothetical protein